MQEFERSGFVHKSKKGSGYRPASLFLLIW